MFDAKSLIDIGGLLLVFLVIYGQTGVFPCFFIPSGAFMFAAGAMLAAGGLNYSFITASSFLVLAGILGNATGYFFGYKVGPKLYDRPDSRFFKQEYVERAKQFYEKYGNWALAIGLFLPIVRTFAPIVSGIIQMKLRRFMFYTTLGSMAWVLSFLLAGYILGSRPALKPYLGYIVVGIIIVVTIPVVIRIVSEFKSEKENI